MKSNLYTSNGNKMFGSTFKTAFLTAFLLLLATSFAKAQSQTLFNGKDLTGWQGDPNLWSVADGAIVGKTAKGQLKHNSFLIYEKPFENFELSLKYKILTGNSGIQYRAKVIDQDAFRVTGYQADIDSGRAVTGILYEEGGRGVVASRGHKVFVGADGARQVEQFADAGRLQKKIKGRQWNDYRIVADGTRLQHYINGQLMADVDDRQPGKRSDKGVIAFQLHVGPAMKVFFKDVAIKELPRSTGAKSVSANRSDVKRVPDSKKLPQWIWHRDPHNVEEAVFKKTFNGKAGQTAVIRGTCDNEMIVLLNGEPIASSSRWEQPIAVYSANVVDGHNELRIQAKDHGGIAALAMSLTIGDKVHVTDDSWKSATPAEAKANRWAKPVSIGVIGGPSLPWRSINANSFNIKASAVRQLGTKQKAIVAPELRVPEGFRAELVFSVPKATHGSWVALTKDNQGRLYTSDQGRQGMYRITPAQLGNPDAVTKVEKLHVAVSGAQGMCWAHDSLYVNAYGSGLWRIQDTDGDDQLDQAENIVDIKNGGEHGMHAVIETPDGKGLYFLAGNHSPTPKFERSRIPTNWKEDLLLPRNWDPRGHARNKLAPGGWIARCEPDGSNVEILSIGYRNQYDIALDRNGEMFTYDADMEWDTGTPWYRPTRVCHVTSGSEFGWRSGSGKWPAYFEDSVAPVMDIGPGSPTGVVFGTGAKFPARYQDALFILDWTFGTIYAIHMQPEGATYRATKETFAWSKPLPVTDAIVGVDGALYFTTGGRGTDSALYRISYVGSESTAPVTGPLHASTADARSLRKQLEGYHGKVDSTAVSSAWPHLASADRAIRYAARIAIENQPVETWRTRALSEPNPQALIMAMIALARQGSQSDLPAIVESLSKIELASLPAQQQLAATRAYGLAFSRMGKPSKAQAQQVAAKLDSIFPGSDDRVNTELARLLIFLESPTVVSKSVQLIANPKPTVLPDWAELAKRNDNYGRPISDMLANMPPLQGIQYAYMLRNATQGWTPETRATYFDFFVDVAKKSGGPSYAGYLTKAREDAVGKLTVAEKHKLADVLGMPLVAPEVKFTPPQGPGRKWTTQEATAVIGNQLRRRKFEKGKNLFHALSCSKCHYFAGSGGSIGPDLTSVANKFSTRDLMEAIVEPSKVISDQYGSKTVLDVDGRIATGLAIESEETLSVYSHDPSLPPTVFNKEDIEEIKDSSISQMPKGLIDTINEEELKDLIAFLKSGGNRRGPMFRK